MPLLLDTHLLVWAALDTADITPQIRGMLRDSAERVVFSVVSIWEGAIKHARHPQAFPIPPGELREGALAVGWEELPVFADHAVAVADLPPIHSDPFDRLLIAQARVEGMTLLTADRTVARYPGLIRRV